MVYPHSDYQSARTTDEALALLRWHWGTAYDIRYAWGMFTASRRDNGATVRRPDAEELDAEILADYHAKPVPRDL